MRAFVGAAGGTRVGGVLGWVLPALLLWRPEEAPALLARRTICAAGVATVGFIVDGSLSVRSSGSVRA